MQAVLEKLVLERMGPADATVGMISLPLPREVADTLTVKHPSASLQPVAWWVRNELPRRALAFVVDSAGVPETLRVGARTESAASDGDAAAAWTLDTRVTKQKLDFKPAKYSNVQSLRGVPAADCTTVEYELLLGFGGRTLSMQFGATGPDGAGAPYHWQNVHLDRLWRRKSVEAVRAGGVIYNGDTYLWADVYLLLFSNGVAHAAAHFVNTKLHIEGYDFQGLPFVRLRGDGVTPVNATLPAGGARFDLGALKLNLADSSSMCSEEFPASLADADGELVWKPFSRTFNPQVETAPPLEWAPGFARTVRFQFSLSDAAPVMARYRVPSWWYALSGEPWPGGYLPVHGKYHRVGELSSEHIRGEMRRGRFDAGSAGFGNDGFAGIGLMRSFYHTGREDLFEAALDYCYYWADIAVDHRDFSVRQWVGGWPWKTCAYSKFRDVLMAYLETGDPYLRDTLEMAAEAYWGWFRANWPRCTIGRDSFELGGWSLLRRYLGGEHARERTREFTRMIGSVLEARGSIGGQMGAGPHPGYLSSLYMTGITMCSLLDVAEAEVEEGFTEQVEAMGPLLTKLHEHWLREDVEMFPSNYGVSDRSKWGTAGEGIWAVLSGRIYPQAARFGNATTIVDSGLSRLANSHTAPLETWAKKGRPGDNFVNPLYHDALLLGARVLGDGIEIHPIGDPASWHPEQTVQTPWGPLKITSSAGPERVQCRFEAGASFPVAVHFGGATVHTTSKGEATFKIGARQAG